MFQLITKVTGDGIVCAASAGRLFVAPLPTDNGVQPSRASGKSVSAKKTCSPSGGCGNCGGCLSADSVPNGYIGKFYVDVGANDAKKYVPGDRVRFCRFIPEPNLMSALVFGVPISSALAAMLFWIAKAPDQIESALAVFSVIAAFFTGIFIVGVIDRIFKTKYPATIINKRADA